MTKKYNSVIGIYKAILLFSLVALFVVLQSGNKPPKQFQINAENEYKQDNDSSNIYLNAVTINTLSKEGKLLQKPITTFSDKQMHLVKFSGAIQPEWYKILTDAGAEIIDYIPNYTYLIFANSTTLQTIQSIANKQQSPIVWHAAYLPQYRLSPTIFGKTAKGSINKNEIAYTKFKVQLYQNETTNIITLSMMQKLQPNNIFVDKQAVSHYINVTVELSKAALFELINRPDVISIHPYIEPKMRDESQAIIMTGQLNGNVPMQANYLNYLANKGFTQAQFDASNFVVNVSDDGLDSGSVANVIRPTAHFALYKNGDKNLATRVAFIHKTGTATDASTRGCNGHGNINTHIIGGYIPDSLLAYPSHTDANNFRYGLGVAPFVKVGNSTIFSPSYTNPNLTNLEADSYRDGARISSNSWGAAVSGAYNSDAQTYDFLVRDAQPATSSSPMVGNQQMVIFFSAGNSGSNAGTIGSPGTAKNVITVGASEGVRAFGGADGCGTTDTEANNLNDIATFSSRGPCVDGRKKPDIQAPGTHITGGVYQSNAVNPLSGIGSNASCFAAAGVCGGLGTNDFFPTGQKWTTASSGTSHSCPAVAGFGALIRQNFINNGLAAPSPALTKAVILNSAGYMNGVGANDNLFSNSQGMGLVNMNNYFSYTNNPNIIKDEVLADVFTATGQTKTFTGVVANTALPLRVTMAYTDAPGSTAGSAFVNNIDVEVYVNGTKYLGNNFTGALSVTGGNTDNKNNVECVFLPAGTTGNIAVKIIAKNIAGNGVPNNSDALDQDYALIITNIMPQAFAVPTSVGPSITQESCGTGTVIDPKEQITVSLPIVNDGSVATNNLVATLQANSNVIMPTAAQNYGAIATNATVSKLFSFFVSANTACGSTITLDWVINDGATNYGVISKTYNVGTTITTLAQNFDAETVPALPTGFTQNQLSGSTINWITSTTTPNSTPNTAFANNPSSVNATALESPVFAVSTNNATVIFQKAFTTENGFDGVVFEIKIGTGAWTDILVAGGSFEVGGYNNTIDNTAANNSPIRGRPAWSGSSSTFTQTIANLPASTNGQNVQVRWLMASDVSVGSTGFRLDDINIKATIACTPCTTLPLQLISFTGNKATGYNLLNWKTEQEINTAFFTVESSVDGKIFKNIGKVNSVTNSNGKYLFKDSSAVTENTIYYRLKMVDKDAQFTYSNIVKIKSNSDVSMTAYPNPVKNNLNIKSTVNDMVVITNSIGQIIKTFKIYKGINDVDVTSWPVGLYYIKTNSQTIKINKL